MLIKSKFKDYYDNLGGVDRSIIYNRQEAHYIINNNTCYLKTDIVTTLPPNSSVYKAFNLLKDINKKVSDSGCVQYTMWPGRFWKSLNLSVLVVGNKIFPTIKFCDQYFYDYDKFLEHYYEQDKEAKPPRFTKSKWEDFYNNCKKQKFIDIQVLLNAPIFFFEFVYGRFHLVDLYVNCSLKKLNTISIIDPYQANQEVSMFLSGVLRQPENKMVEITDEKAFLAKHGMGDLSFKQGAPGKKKKQRRKNKAKKRGK